MFPILLFEVVFLASAAQVGWTSFHAEKARFSIEMPTHPKGTGMETQNASGLDALLLLGALVPLGGWIVARRLGRSRSAAGSGRSPS